MELVSTLTKPTKHDPRFADDHGRHVWYFERLKSSGSDTKLIKMADRLHNMRTLGCCPPQKQVRKIKETRDVYFPLIEDIAKDYPDKAKYLSSQLEDALKKLEV